MSTPEDTSAKTKQPRASNAFFLMQSILIHMLTKTNPPTPTAEIAERLGMDRSYVIRLAADGVVLAPANEREQRLFDIATSDEFARKFQNLGLKGLLGGENIVITLAGNVEAPRPKLGPLDARKEAKAAKATAKANTASEPAPEPAQDAPKAKRGRKPKEAAPEPAPEPQPAPKKASKPRKAKAAPEPAPEPEPAPKAASKPPKKASKAKAPVADIPSADEIMDA